MLCTSIRRFSGWIWRPDLKKKTLRPKIEGWESMAHGVSERWAGCRRAPLTLQVHILATPLSSAARTASAHGPRRTLGEPQSTSGSAREWICVGWRDGIFAPSSPSQVRRRASAPRTRVRPWPVCGQWRRALLDTFSAQRDPSSRIQLPVTT